MPIRVVFTREDASSVSGRITAPATPSTSCEYGAPGGAGLACRAAPTSTACFPTTRPGSLSLSELTTPDGSPGPIRRLCRAVIRGTSPDVCESLRTAW